MQQNAAEAYGSIVEAERSRVFKGLAEGHLEECYGLANAILADPAEARDAVHDAFINAWQHFGSLRDPTRFEWWFKRIVVNACRNRLRTRRRRPTSDLADHPTLRTPDAFATLDDRLQLEQAIAGLRPDDRILLALRYYHDLRLDDIAAVLDIPLGTVKSRLTRAHARLRIAFERPHRQDRPR